KGLSGLEWAGGLPGTVGGAIRGNSGAFGGKTSDVVKSVSSIELASGKLIERDNADCLFGYRDSIFKNSGRGEFILEVVFELTSAEREAVLKLTKENLSYRENHHPMDCPSLGCMFKNIPFKNVPERFKKELKGFCKGDPPMLPTASLIEKLGLKGTKKGGVEISEKHANFFVNRGGGLPDDVKILLKLVKERVKAAYGIELEEEIEIV
ncbi:MAG: UDP-N-acetylmuramate dehydrogenase, partial [Patescibacteria group bacterium]